MNESTEEFDGGCSPQVIREGDAVFEPPPHWRAHKARMLEQESEIVQGLARIAADEGRNDMARMRADDAAQCLCVAAKHCEDNGEAERAESFYERAQRLREAYR